jgi:phosphate transport system substrate-binding protein
MEADSGESLKGNIAISGAFALYPMTVKWAEEFNKVYPDVRIDISAGGAGKGMADALSGIVDLGMFSREIMQAEKDRGVWWVAVCIDAVLPTISANNPVLADLKNQGLKREVFIDIFIKENIKIWQTVIGRDGNDVIDVFTRSDACGAAGTWAIYLGGFQEDLKGIGVFGDPGLADAVKNDPLGIGFNNTIYIYNLNTGKKYDGLEVIPIDVNENGVIDEDENFYDTMGQIMQAIADGKYPSPPARELYFVAKGKPEQKIVRKFLQWILSDGQQFVAEAGYVKLSEKYINEEINKLD